MTDVVKLLTEAEVKQMFLSVNVENIIAELRERGLIAPEPVDPLLIEAREICARVCEGWRDIPVERGQQYREGSHDDEVDVAYALAALKRGMEMRAPLTREMVKAAYLEAAVPSAGRAEHDKFFDRLHAALTKEQS